MALLLLFSFVSNSKWKNEYSRKHSKLLETLTNFDRNSSCNPSRCMSLIGTWLPILSASNLRVNTVPKFWIPIYAFREGSCTGTNAGQLLNKKPLRNMTEIMLVRGAVNY
jgi:hypothetical protein